MLRTAENQIEYGIDATTSADVVKGVKGPSVIRVLPSFDQVRGIAVDFMHCVCLGVARQFVGMWMDSKHHQQSYYIGRRKREINNRLLAIDVPGEISHAPRSIGDRKFWKA